MGTTTDTTAAATEMDTMMVATTAVDLMVEAATTGAAATGLGEPSCEQRCGAASARLDMRGAALGTLARASLRRHIGARARFHLR